MQNFILIVNFVFAVTRRSRSN